MDVSSQALSSALLNQTAAQTSQAIQTSVLKKALNAQAAQVLGLLQAVPQPTMAPTPTGDLPLAAEGAVGTRLNTRA